MNTTGNVIPLGTAKQRRLRRQMQSALDVQNACNISGVAHHLAELCRELRSDGSSTSELRTSPMVRLVVAKLADMCAIASTYPLEDELRLQAALDIMATEDDSDEPNPGA